MRARGTRTLTMALLLLVPPLLFVLAELSWLLGRRAEAVPVAAPERALSVAGASLAGAVVCPLVAVILGVRLHRTGHRALGASIVIAAPLLMVMAARGRLF